jgi:hypothetical protein
MMDAIASVLFALAGTTPTAPAVPSGPPGMTVPIASPAATAPAVPTESAGTIAQELRLDLGIASAVGFAGVTYSLAPTTGFLAELGVGVGASGLQLSVMPKLVIGASAHRFIIGAGPSVGIPGVTIVTNNGPFGSNENEHVVTPWLNAEIGYDYRSRTGAAFLVAGGITVGLAHGCAVSIDSCTELYGLILPQIRVGFGHWF